MNKNLLCSARKMCAGFVTLLVGTCLLVGLAGAREVEGLTGKWKMVSTTSGGDAVNWTLLFKRDGESWSAIVSSEGEEAPAKELKVEGGAIHMKTPYRGEFYDVDLKLDGDRLTGKWSGNGDTGPTKGTRITAAAAAAQ